MLQLCLSVAALRVPSVRMAAPSVTVVGGSGFVGSRVCELLVARGAAVRSVSKSGKAPEWCAGQEWAQQVTWVANDLVRGAREELEAAVGTPDAVVSCVGAVGFGVRLRALQLDDGPPIAEAVLASSRNE